MRGGDNRTGELFSYVDLEGAGAARSFAASDPNDCKRGAVGAGAFSAVEQITGARAGRSRLPSRAVRLPSGPLWIHEIKHDGYRLMVRRDGARVRCFTKNGYDWAARFPAIVDAALRLKAQSFLSAAWGWRA